MKRLLPLILCALLLISCSPQDARANLPGYAKPVQVAAGVLDNIEQSDAYVLAEEAEDSPLREPLKDIADRMYRLASDSLEHEILVIQSKEDVDFIAKDNKELLETVARQRAETLGMEYGVVTSAFYAAMVFGKDKLEFRDILSTCNRVFSGELLR